MPSPSWAKKLPVSKHRRFRSSTVFCGKEVTIVIPYERSDSFPASTRESGFLPAASNAPSTITALRRSHRQLVLHFQEYDVIGLVQQFTSFASLPASTHQKVLAPAVSVEVIVFLSAP
jgi:hypothetical protein